MKDLHDPLKDKLSMHFAKHMETCNCPLSRYVIVFIYTYIRSLIIGKNMYLT